MATGKGKKGFHKTTRNPQRKRGRYHRIRFVVPLTERMKIAAAYLEGGSDNTPPKLAIRFKRSLETIYAIVRAPAVEEVGRAMEQKLIETSAEEVAERIRYEVKARKSKAGAWIAMELAERWGAIPPKIRIGRPPLNQNGPQPMVPLDKPEEERVEDIVRQLTKITMERQRIFGMPMPEIEEEVIEVDVLKKEQAE